MTRPCRAPYQAMPDVGWVGGGQVPLPGEVSQALKSMVSLDELPNCQPHILKMLRQPLETGMVSIQARPSWTTPPGPLWPQDPASRNSEHLGTYIANA